MAYWIDMFGNKVKHISLAPMVNIKSLASRGFPIHEQGIGIQDDWEPFSLWNLTHMRLERMMSQHTRNFRAEFLNQGNFVIKSSPRDFNRNLQQASAYKKIFGDSCSICIIDEVGELI